MKTPAEIATLKSSWYADGGWDLEDSEGFEAHRDELLAYRKQVEGARAERRAKEHEEAIERLIRPALDLPADAIKWPQDISRETIHTCLRLAAEMLLPIVQRMEYLDDQHDRKLDRIQEQIDVLTRR